jgi:nucleoside phosphorylase
MRKTASSGGQQPVDVLIVTAVKEEYDAVLDVETGAVPGSRWENQDGPVGLEVAFRQFHTLDGRLLRVAATRALEMGGVAATNAAVPLLREYSPRCLAMCGVCAGRRGEVQLGDVVVADRLWFYDAGKIKVTVDKEGRRIKRIRGDISTYQLNPAWKQKAESFALDPAPWLLKRPRTYEEQGDWLLERLLQGEDPSRHRFRKSRCTNYDKVEGLLRKANQIRVRNGALELTKAGRAHIDERLRLYGGKLPKPKPLKVHVAPIGSGNQVVQDEQIFDRLSISMRKVLGLEMEAAAIGAIAHHNGIPFTIVMKGVMDFADPKKNDNFKPFAARASAECLLAFLRAHLPPPEGPAPARARAAFSSTKNETDDLLDPGTAPRPRDPATCPSSSRGERTCWN